MAPSADEWAARTARLEKPDSTAAQVVRWQSERLAIDALRDQLAPEASDMELQLFAEVCTRLDLSPFADQIVLIGRHDSRAGRKVHRHQITVAGRRALAERTGELVAIEGPVWCGPRDEYGHLNWLDVWPYDDQPPYAARVLVGRRGWDSRANGTAKWSEFVQRTQQGQVTAMWARMPSHMLGKVAESMALRRAFPNVIDQAAVGTWAGAGSELTEATAVNAVDGETFEDYEGQGLTQGTGLSTASGPAASASGASAPDAGRPATGVYPPDLGSRASDQAAAHRAIGAMTADGRAAFLERWGIETFGEAWPAEAVRDALEAPF